MAWNSALPDADTTVSGSCDVYQKNWEAISEVFLQQHKHVSVATSPHHSAGEVSVFLVNTHAYIAAITPVVCAFGYDTTYHTMVGWLNEGLTGAGGFVPSGSEMLFYQDVAPTGWVIKTELNDKLAYITKGSVAGGVAGGAEYSGGTWYLSGASGNLGVKSTTLALNQIPSHRHTYYLISSQEYMYPFPGAYVIIDLSPDPTMRTGETGSYLPQHKHEMNFSDQWRPDAYNCIVCTKV